MIIFWGLGKDLTKIKFLLLIITLQIKIINRKQIMVLRTLIQALLILIIQITRMLALIKKLLNKKNTLSKNKETLGEKYLKTLSRKKVK